MKSEAYEYDFSYSEWSGFIDEYVFDETDRYILKRHLLDAATFNKISLELNPPLEEKSTKIRYNKAKHLFFNMLIKKHII